MYYDQNKSIALKAATDITSDILTKSSKGLALDRLNTTLPLIIRDFRHEVLTRDRNLDEDLETLLEIATRDLHNHAQIIEKEDSSTNPLKKPDRPKNVVTSDSSNMKIDSLLVKKNI